jgi:hypothetical protein
MRNEVRTAIVTAGLVVLVLFPAVSSAHRWATKRERTDVARAAHQRPECVNVEVSTTQPGWAVLYSRPRAKHCAGADGYIVLGRGSHGGWKIALEGAGTDQSPCRGLPQIPPAVGADLGVCINPPKPRAPYLGTSDAMVYTLRALDREFGSRGPTSGHQVGRCVRKSGARVECEASWRFADLSFDGPVAIWLTGRGYTADWNYSFRITRVNDACETAAPGANECVRVFVVT